jgi:hypothetical protein
MLRRFIIIIIRRGVGRHSKYELKSDVLYISKEYIYVYNYCYCYYYYA